MRLVTLSGPDRTRAARVGDGGDDGHAAGAVVVELDAPDVGALLADPGWRTAPGGARHDLAAVALAPVVPCPGKIFCVGLNYRAHIVEMGRELPSHPTLFAKFPEALIGPTDPIELDPASAAVDWEAELAVVIGSRVRRAGSEEAAAAIAGFSVLNDITMRDCQYRSTQWLQGKTFEATTPFGPQLVTPDELPGAVAPALDLTCTLDGEVVQSANTSDLVFSPVALVEYISTIVTLNPGDVIATGTPGGVGHTHQPPRYLADGSVLVSEIAGLGRLTNTARSRVPARPSVRGVTTRAELPELVWVAAGSSLLLDALHTLGDAALDAATALPGWSRRHLLGHVASNAEALGRLLSWAGTGVESRMYASPDQRAADIESGSARPVAQLRDAVGRGVVDLDRAVAALPERAWSAEVVTAQGRTVPAREVPWMRAREVCVHAVDLGTGRTFADLPAAFCRQLVGDVARWRAARGDGRALVLEATDTGQVWQVAGTGPAQRVHLPVADLAAWITGRTNRTDLPTLSGWL